MIFVVKANGLLNNSQRRLEIAKKGNDMAHDKFSKENQWKRFQDILASV